MKKGSIVRMCTIAFVCCVLGFALLSAGVPSALAFQSYHDPNTEGQGFCTTCHPGFVGGFGAPLHHFM